MKKADYVKNLVSVLRRSSFFGASMPLGIFRDIRVDPLRAHAHEFSEIVLVDQGSANHVMSGESRKVSAGDVFVLASGQVHGYENCNDFGVYNILFDLGRLDLLSSDLYELPGFHALFSLEPGLRRRHLVSCFRLEPHELRYCVCLAKTMARELNSSQPGVVYFATISFMRLVGFLARKFTESPSPGKHSLLRLGQVLSHIRKNFTSPLNVADLSALAHMSEAQFYRKFRDSTGCSPMEYINRLRMACAEEMLRQSDHSISEIAYLCGFNDSNYFSRMFSRTRGKSPRKFRKDFPV